MPTGLPVFLLSPSQSFASNVKWINYLDRVSSFSSHEPARTAAIADLPPLHRMKPSWSCT